MSLLLPPPPLPLPWPLEQNIAPLPAQPSLGRSILPSPRCPRAPRLLPVPCLLTPGPGCPPRARELIAEGKNSDKGLNIACHDGKHFVERSVDKRGNRAVKKIGGEGYRGRNGAETGLTATIWGRQEEWGRSSGASTVPWTARPQRLVFSLPRWSPPRAVSLASSLGKGVSRHFLSYRTGPGGWGSEMQPRWGSRCSPGERLTTNVEFHHLLIQWPWTNH